MTLAINKKQYTRICVNCGVPFLGTKKHKFCSIECRNTDKRSHIVCSVCGKTAFAHGKLEHLMCEMCHQEYLLQNCNTNPRKIPSPKDCKECGFRFRRKMTFKECSEVHIAANGDSVGGCLVAAARFSEGRKCANRLINAILPDIPDIPYDPPVKINWVRQRRSQAG